jgi:hypothetical protein
VWLIGRQPILDRDERITAYELLFRSPGEDGANIVDPVAATATVILGTLSGFGVEQILGVHQGFVNVDQNLLFDDALELLPRESVVLELLESVRPTEAVVLRCEQLWAGGWKFALDDHEYAPEYEPLYPYSVPPEGREIIADCPMIWLSPDQGPGGVPTPDHSSRQRIPNLGWTTEPGTLHVTSTSVIQEPR